jgi:hypothetical protein
LPGNRIKQNGVVKLLLNWCKLYSLCK